VGPRAGYVVLRCVIMYYLWDFKFSRRRVWCSELSSGLYCRVKWLSTDVSEVRTASIIRDGWRQYAPLKRRSTIILHGSITQKTTLNIECKPLEALLNNTKIPWKTRWLSSNINGAKARLLQRSCYLRARGAVNYTPAYGTHTLWRWSYLKILVQL